MKLSLKGSVLVSRVTIAAAMLCAALLTLAGSGCSTRERTVAPAPSATGMLIALKDDRPVDGGVDLTMDVRPGVSELWRVPSAFRPDNQAILAIHAVVDQARIGETDCARPERATNPERCSSTPWRS